MSKNEKVKELLESLEKTPKRGYDTAYLNEWMSEGGRTVLGFEDELQEFYKDFPFPWGAFDDTEKDYIETLCKGVARHFAGWQKEQFEKNRLAACDKMTKEEYDRETEFALGIINKEHRQPTFSDAIEYGMRIQKEKDDKLIALSKYSWYQQGVIDGQFKGLTDDEKYQQGRFDMKEQMMKEGLDAIKHDNSDIIERTIAGVFVKYGMDKQKELHYTKRNALFDKCVENCDPKVMKEVSDSVDEMLQKEQKPEHLELKAGHWYICHRAYCCRADHLTVKEGERFQCEKDGIVKGFVIKEPEKYFKECSAPAPMEDDQKEQKPAENSVYPHSLDEAIQLYYFTYGNGKGGFDYLSLPKFQDIVEEFVEDYGQKPAEWSEDDEEKMRDLVSLLAILEGCSTVIVGTTARYDGWLNSFRSRPKSSDNWKPSEEQMEALRNCTIPGTTFDIESLKSLYEQLKKLQLIGCGK